MPSYGIDSGPDEVTPPQPVSNGFYVEVYKINAVRFSIAHPALNNRQARVGIFVVIDEVTQSWGEDGRGDRGVAFTGYLKPEEGDQVLHWVKGVYSFSRHGGYIETEFEIELRTTPTATVETSRPLAGSIIEADCGPSHSRPIGHCW